MRKLYEYVSDDSTYHATVWYSPAKQEYYVEFDSSTSLDLKFTSEADAIECAEDYTLSLGLDDGDADFD